MFAVGDIVRIFSPIAGHHKFHLCIEAATDTTAAKFLFLNSNPNYEGSYSVPCARVPCIEESDTGQTAFSFSIIPRYNSDQLKNYNAEKIGELDTQLAKELLTFAETVKTLARPDLRIVKDALDAIAKRSPEPKT